ncbi:hypothetical protein MMC25_005520 [Agyrium rufum]|nr:hypothetical protein [Agyrium rufum]
MEEHVLHLLEATQLAAAETRQDAEAQLQELCKNGVFSRALLSIAAHNGIATNNRQAALNVLRIFVRKAWSPSLSKFEGVVLVDDPTKESIRRNLFNIILDGEADNKVTTGAAVVVCSIAKVDFPDEWPDLLTNLLEKVPTANDGQVHDILIVLVALLDEGIDDEGFARHCQAIISTLYEVAVSTERKPSVRALAVHVFGNCFDSIEMIKQEDKELARQISQHALEIWFSFVIDLLKAPVPQVPSRKQEDEGDEVAVTWRGSCMLKAQALRCLGKVQTAFPTLLKSSVTNLFAVCFKLLQDHAEFYKLLYIDSADRQSKSTNADDLQYTFDLLVLEEIDYLSRLVHAPDVKRNLESLLDPLATSAIPQGASPGWAREFLIVLVNYAFVPAEDEEMWDIDINIFLESETAASSNYTPREAVAKLARTLVEERPTEFLMGIVDVMSFIFSQPQSNWKHKEAILFILQTTVDNIFFEKDQTYPQIAVASVDMIRSLFHSEAEILRARAHRAAATMLCCSGPSFQDTAVHVGLESLDACTRDDSNIVQIMIIRAMQDYNRYIPSAKVLDVQAKTIAAVSRYFQAQDMEEFNSSGECLSDTLLETLRDTIGASPRTSLQHDALGILFKLVKESPYNLVTMELAVDAFEAIVQEVAQRAKEDYFELSNHVLPILMGAIDVAIAENHEEFGESVLTMLTYLTEKAPANLPPGFVDSVMPKLCRIIFMDKDSAGVDAAFLHQKATSVIQLMISHEPEQVFAWKDPEIGKSGLEMTLLVIERLLGPNIEDVSAAEVGSLAVELVSKADVETIRPLLPNLLKVAAQRLALARHDPLIQSLTLLFANLVLHDASEFLTFLESIHPLGEDQPSGLEVVLRKWVEHSINFVGSDAINMNIRALSNVYRLFDPRILAIRVQGDLIINPNSTSSSRIKTRAAAKREPDQYEIISLQLKLLKLLIAELPADLSPFMAPPPATSSNPNSVGGSAVISPMKASLYQQDGDSDEDDGDDDDWSDASADQDFASTQTPSFAARAHRGSLIFSDAGGNVYFDRSVIDALIDFFVQVAGWKEFQSMCADLKEDERAKLRSLEGVVRSREGE